MTIKIIPNGKGSPAGKLADAELHFDAAEGGLDGLKLIGFAVWERRGGGRNVTFPARQYSVNGERRSFALLRPLGDTSAQDRIRDLILAAYAETEVSHPLETLGLCARIDAIDVLVHCDESAQSSQQQCCSRITSRKSPSV